MFPVWLASSDQKNRSDKQLLNFGQFQQYFKRLLKDITLWVLASKNKHTIICDTQREPKHPRKSTQHVSHELSTLDHVWKRAWSFLPARFDNKFVFSLVSHRKMDIQSSVHPIFSLFREQMWLYIFIYTQFIFKPMKQSLVWRWCVNGSAT